MGLRIFCNLTEKWCNLTETAAQRSCGCLISGGAQGHVGWGPGQLSWWGAALPMAGGGAGWALKSFQPKPFYDGTAYKKLG